ncbi:MAG: efflux RND transporter permease subunit [Acidobacteriota bacterium]
MNLTRLSLDNRTATLVFLVLLFVAGMITYTSLPRAEDPGFQIRVAVVTTLLPGASPDRVELLLTDPLEEAIEEIAELDFVTSESRTGASVIEVNFGEQYANLDPLFAELRDKIDDVRPDLPVEALGPFINDDFGDVFGTVLAVTGDGYSVIELERVAEQVRARLLALPDVGKVEILGAQDERIFVEYDEARLADLGLTPLQLAGILQAQNILDPAGDVRTPRERLALEVSGNFETVEAIRRTTFRLPDGSLAALEDVADVRRGTVDPPTVKTRYNGLPAVVLAVAMHDDGKITKLGPEILDIVESMKVDYPVGIDFHLVSYQTTHVEGDVNKFVVSLLQGIGIVLVVMLITLGLRTGFIVAAVIPMTMVGSLVFMSLFGITLNKMSLAALIISLGLLVDSAIVVAESILVAIREGKKPVPAAIAAAAELRLPLLVSSLTTAAALLPTYLAESTTGEYTSAIFEVVTIALLLAWVLALTMTPLLCVLFGERPKDGQTTSTARDLYDSGFYRWYRGRLLFLLRRPIAALLGFVILLVSALWAFQFVPQLFFPRKEQTTFTIALELPYGSPFQFADRVTRDVEAYMRKELNAELASDEERPWFPNTDRVWQREGVVNWASFIGSGAPRFVLGYNPEQPRPNYVYMIANASSYGAQAELIEQIEGYVRATWPDVVPRVEKLRNGPPLDYPVEIRLSGDDVGQLFEMARGLEHELDEQPGTINVGNDWGAWIKKLRVEVDEARARDAGLTNRDIAMSLQTATSGLALTDYREGNDLIPVILRSREARADGIDQLRGLDVAAQTSGARTPLEQVAALEVAFQPSKVLRRDRQRTVTIQADLDPDADRTVTPFSVVGGVMPWLEEQAASWPLGYKFELGGEVESSGEAQASIQAKMPIAVLIIVSLLVLQFNSIREPLIVLITLPFTLVGVVSGLLVSQNPFGFMALLGVIALFGVVINNAVVLLDRIRTEIRDHGRSRAEAVLEASQRRLRPILLTTATTVAGLVPLWLTGGPMFSPMAMAFLAGLVISTVLTLGLVPVLYAIFFRVKFS